MSFIRIPPDRRAVRATLCLARSVPAFVAACMLLPTMAACQSHAGPGASSAAADSSPAARGNAAAVEDHGDAAVGRYPLSSDDGEATRHGNTGIRNPPAAAGGASAAGGDGDSPVQKVAIPDPTFRGMSSGTLTVPAGWKARAELVYHGCLGADVPDAALDTSSPDGEAEFGAVPKYEWRWGWGAQYGRGCIPLRGVMSAAEFLKALAPQLPGQVRIVAEMPVSDAFRGRELKNVAMQSQVQQALIDHANRTYPPQFARWLSETNEFKDVSGDVAAARAVDGSGHELRLRVWTLCMQNPQAGNCSAMVDILRAPKGRLDALAARLDNPDLFKLAIDDHWKAAYSERQQGNFEAAQARQQQFSQALRLQEQQGSQMLRQQYLDSSARLNANHQAFMQQQQQSFNRSTQAWQTQMNARSTAASDTVDYALGQQTVSGANGTYKTSSQYSNVWSSPSAPAPYDGRTYGAMDNTVNPNTATDNTWTRDYKVHGNGQPYSSGHP